MTEDHGHPVNILLVEDDDVDAAAFQRALARKEIANPVLRARDGLEALGMLRGTGGATQVDRPYLIVLDLDMPRMNGHEFLEEIRKDPALRDSVVFVLTTSDEDRDRTEAFRRNVAGYVLKGNTGDSFMEAVNQLERFWSMVSVPGDAT